MSDDDFYGGNDDPMQTRLNENMQDPYSLVQQGLNHLNNPDNGLSYEQKMAAVVPLLQAKHFQGPPPLKSQGGIQSGTYGNQGVLGFANKILGGAGAANKLGILNSSGGATAGASTGAGAGASIGEMSDADILAL